MGNLRKYMPYTYLTFLAGWLAICGIIPFSGFWSKDEILWRTASTNHIPLGWLLWIVGTIAATCTAFYMTRLVAMTFWGKERFLGDHDSAHDWGAKKQGKSDHHAHTPHESPKSMWVPLVVLAILATIGGLVGISTAFTGGKEVGGRMNIVTWLSPIVWNPGSGQFGEEVGEERESSASDATTGAEKPRQAEPGGGIGPGRSPYGDTGFNLARAVDKIPGSHFGEWVFIIISLAVAGLGIGLGFLFYVKDTKLADAWAARLKPLYQASYNKYWIDEFYGWTFTRRTMDLARGVFWVDSKVVDGGVNGSAWLTRLTSRITGGTDKYFVDGLVNAIAGFVTRLMSPLVRAAQTGLTQNYALVMVIGLLIAVALYLVKIL